MRALTCLLIIGLITGIVAFSPDTASAQMCESVVTVKWPIDTDPPPSSGNYDPCDNWLKWTVSFHRSDEIDDFAAISFEVQGTSVYRQFWDYSYSEGNHSVSENIYVGPSIQHNLVFDANMNCNGHFTGIEGKCQYFASTPD